MALSLPFSAEQDSHLWPGNGIFSTGINVGVMTNVVLQAKEIRN